MINDKTKTQKHIAHKPSTGKLDTIRTSRWKKRIRVKAARIKRQLQIENRFHKAVSEMRTTTDRFRLSYLHWILNNMFSRFDYESGLRAINDKAAYQAWLSVNQTGKSR